MEVPEPVRTGLLGRECENGTSTNPTRPGAWRENIPGSFPLPIRSTGLTGGIASGSRPSHAFEVAVSGSGIADSFEDKKGLSRWAPDATMFGELRRETGRDAVLASEPLRCASSFSSIYTMHGAAQGRVRTVHKTRVRFPACMYDRHVRDASSSPQYSRRSRFLGRTLCAVEAIVARRESRTRNGASSCLGASRGCARARQRRPGAATWWSAGKIGGQAGARGDLVDGHYIYCMVRHARSGRS